MVRVPLEGTSTFLAPRMRIVAAAGSIASGYEMAMVVALVLAGGGHLQITETVIKPVAIPVMDLIAGLRTSYDAMQQARAATHATATPVNITICTETPDAGTKLSKNCFVN